jgi:hypothetical protein
LILNAITRKTTVARAPAITCTIVVTFLIFMPFLTPLNLTVISDCYIFMIFIFHYSRAVNSLHKIKYILP